MLTVTSSWIGSREMTDEEQVLHPEHATAGGYLKILDTKSLYAKLWESLTENEKKIIKNIPNFDAKKFKQITGITITA